MSSQYFQTSLAQTLTSPHLSSSSLVARKAEVLSPTPLSHPLSRSLNLNLFPMIAEHEPRKIIVSVRTKHYLLTVHCCVVWNWSLIIMPGPLNKDVKMENKNTGNILLFKIFTGEHYSKNICEIHGNQYRECMCVTHDSMTLTLTYTL